MILVSYNITLSSITANDAADIVACMGDKEIFNQTMRIPFPYSYENARLWIEDCLIFEEENGFNQNFAIRNREGKMMGAIGFHFNYGLHSDKSEVGYWLGKAYWNQGIMTAVLKKLCELGQSQYKLKMLEAHVFDFNAASQKVLVHAGFTEKEHLPGWYKKEDKRFDAVRFEKVL